MFQKGYFESSYSRLSSSELESALSSFIKREESYRKQFLQSNYNYAFDGYSFKGQKDSSNQYDFDLLHSFVLSDLRDSSSFPEEFGGFLSSSHAEVLSLVSRVEREIIRELNVPGLEGVFENQIGHMISCNFYPKVEKEEEETDLRLSAHKDVSLFTVFPFGFDADFEFQNAEGEWQRAKSTNKVIVFPGYLSEVLSGGKIKAMNHRVKMPENNKERFSFAYFSIPKQNQLMKLESGSISSEQYFEDYLSLF